MKDYHSFRSAGPTSPFLPHQHQSSTPYRYDFVQSSCLLRSAFRYSARRRPPSSAWSSCYLAGCDLYECRNQLIKQTGEALTLRSADASRAELDSRGCLDWLTACFRPSTPPPPQPEAPSPPLSPITFTDISTQPGDVSPPPPQVSFEALGFRVILLTLVIPPFTFYFACPYECFSESDIEQCEWHESIPQKEPFLTMLNQQGGGGDASPEPHQQGHRPHVSISSTISGSTDSSDAGGPPPGRPGHRPYVSISSTIASDGHHQYPPAYGAGSSSGAVSLFSPAARQCTHTSPRIQGSSSQQTTNRSKSLAKGAVGKKANTRPGVKPPAVKKPPTKGKGGKQVGRKDSGKVVGKKVPQGRKAGGRQLPRKTPPKRTTTPAKKVNNRAKKPNARAQSKGKSAAPNAKGRRVQGGKGAAKPSKSK